MVRWYLQFPISYRELERMLADRGVAVDHTTLFRWIQVYAPELDQHLQPRLRPTMGSWRVDETDIRVKNRVIGTRGRALGSGRVCSRFTRPGGTLWASWPRSKPWPETPDL